MRARDLLPDSALCHAAIDYAQAVSPPYLFHHVMRSAVYAELIGQRRALPYDREVVCVSSVLHDLGLTGAAPGEARFEIEGADIAREFASRRGMSDVRIALVWDAISLHTSAEIPLRRSPETALCQLGIAADLAELPPELTGDARLEALRDDHPTLDLKSALLATLVGLYRRNPRAAASHAVADACERCVPGFRRFNLCDHLLT